MNRRVFVIATILIGLGWILTAQPARMGANAVRPQDTLPQATITPSPLGLSPDRVEYDFYGKTGAVVISGTLAYIGYNQHLLILDITHVDLPIVLGVTDSLVDLINDISVVGNTAYVVTTYGYGFPGTTYGLHIIDVSDPTAPTEIGFYPTSATHDPVGVTIDGNIAYLTEIFAGLHAIDVSNPAAPVSIGLFPISYPIDVEIVGTRAYVTDAYFLLHVVDITDPSAPVSLAQIPLSGQGLAVSIVGDYVYVAVGYGCSCLQIFDLSDLAAPIQLGYLYLPQDLYDVTMYGRYAYIADWYAGLRIVDVANPASPVEIGAYDTPGNARDVALSGSYAYMADGFRGLRIIDIVDPLHPFEAGFYDWSGNISAALIPPEGGQFETWPDHVIYHFASGAFTDTVSLTHLTQYPGAVPSIGDLRRLICSCDSTNGVYSYGFFEATATYSNTGQTAALAPGQTYTMTLRYGEIHKGTIIEDTLGLYAWNGVQWVKETTSVVDITTNTITATPHHFGLFAILGETNSMFLPATLKNY